MSEQENHYQQLGKKTKKEILTTQQINTAKSTIQDNHPLSRIPLVKAVPWLRFFKFCMKKPKKDFRLALRKSLLKKMDMKMPKSDIMLEEDPFLRLGFGMNAYFDTLKYLGFMMIFIFICIMPIMYIYQGYSGIKNDNMGAITKFSLGNMGGAGTLCKQAPFGTDIPLSCKSGQFDGSSAKFGIIPSDATKTNQCLNDDFTKQCHEYIDFKSLSQSIIDKCHGKASCKLNKNDIQWVTGVTPIEKCNNEDAQFFVQMACTFTVTEMNNRQVQGLFVGCMGVFIALFFVVFVDYMRSVFKNSFVEWDVKTITAGDYSIELDISENMWNKFLREVYQESSGLTKVEAFKEYLQFEIEERLTRLPDLGYEENPPDRMRISMITFAFDNAKLINLLRQRGTNLKFEQYDKMRQVNKKIDEMKSNPQTLQAMNRPVTAFLTLENEEALNRAKSYNEVVMKDDSFADIRTLLGEPLQIDDASEPTDIIWENRRFTAWDRFKRTVVVIFCIFILLFISFMFIFMCSKKAATPILRYPASANCQELNSTYGITLLKYAIIEKEDNQPAIDKDEETSFMGFTQCFCLAEKNNKEKADKIYSYPGLKDADGNVIQSATCQQWNKDIKRGKLIGNAMSFMIVAINTILRLILINLIRWIGEDTHSKQIKSITNGVFITQFFNTAVLIILVNANFGEIGLPLAQVFKGPFYDFIPTWYTAVGYRLTQTMMINAIFPYVEFTIAYTRLALARKIDRSWGSDTYKTKKTSMQIYVDQYSGPEYMIHFKYSGMMNITFVTLMYGLGMPILFPIAAVSYFILYTHERLLTAYFYQLPPTFDDKLTKNAMGTLRWAAVLHLFVGYWMLSNQQIFQNIWHYINTPQTLMLTGHTFDKIRVDQAAPLILMGCAIAIIIFMQAFFKKTLRKWGFSFGGSKINVDENLPYFFTAIKLKDADWLLKENDNLKIQYGFKIISDDVSKVLDTTSPPKKAIQGVPYYIILANPRYYRDFQYIPCDVPDRAALIKDDDEDEENDCEQSDMVSMVLNMGYVPEYVIERFKFETGFSKLFKPAMKAYRADHPVHGTGFTPRESTKKEATKGAAGSALMGKLTQKFQQ